MSNSSSSSTTSSLTNSCEGNSCLQDFHAAPTFPPEGIQSTLRALLCLQTFRFLLYLLPVRIVWPQMFCCLFFSCVLADLSADWYKIYLVIWGKKVDLHERHEFGGFSPLSSIVTSLLSVSFVAPSPSSKHTYGFHLHIVTSRLLTQIPELQVLFTDIIHTLFHIKLITVSLSLEACWEGTVTYLHCRQYPNYSHPLFCNRFRVDVSVISKEM